MSHMRQHAGFTTQAKRRGEEYVLCNTCGQRHARNNTYPVNETDQRITPLRLAGLVMFCLGMFAVLAFALPVVLIGFFGGGA